MKKLSEFWYNLIIIIIHSIFISNFTLHGITIKWLDFLHIYQNVRVILNTKTTEIYVFASTNYFDLIYLATFDTDTEIVSWIYSFDDQDLVGICTYMIEKQAISSEKRMRCFCRNSGSNKFNARHLYDFQTECWHIWNNIYLF